jgi:hypothetical protein
MQAAQGLPITTINTVTVNLTQEMVRLARFALGMPGSSSRRASLARIALAAGLLVLVAGVSASAQTVQKTQPDCPSPASAFTQLTYDENNRYSAIRIVEPDSWTA